ncbi:hypothetical protein [Paraflavitalea speifideaquila]|uniref:hypothetical protein n=1 Tax=Paraflavitalea speifideaquila TaxID=3076558 RepID=UPI0028EA6BAE|nr:hypothetical protein [Paraflavitalea speifideiaquila]
MAGQVWPLRMEGEGNQEAIISLQNSIITNGYCHNTFYLAATERNKGALFGMVVIVLSLLVALLAYILAPDGTPMPTG